MAVFSTIGNIIASDKQSDAIDRSSDISQENLETVLRYQDEVRQDNKALFDPYMQGGVAANQQLNALLGLAPPPQAIPTSNPPLQPQPVQPNRNQQLGIEASLSPGGSFDGRVTNGAGLPYGLGDNFMRTGTFNNGAFDQDRQIALQQPGLAQSNPQDSAFENFRNSTGYEFRLGEGLDAVTSAYAGIGGLQSGAAMRGINDYAQNYASNEFGNYAGLLSQQQAVGAGAASSVAGVNQDFANNATAASNLASTNAANAALAQGQSAANVWSGLGNSLGGAAGVAYGILG